jgi:hypothetical protein
MKTLFSQLSSLLGVIKSVEIPKKNILFIENYSCVPLPPSLIHYDACVSGCIGFLNCSVLHVFKLTSLTQIAKSVIRPNAIYMVYSFSREFSKRMEPCKSVHLVKLPVYLQCAVSIRRNCPDLATGGSIVGSFDSFKQTRFWTVIEKFAQTLCGKIGLSHDTVPSLIGQRPRRVDSTSGLRHFSFYAFGCTA